MSDVNSPHIVSDGYVSHSSFFMYQSIMRRNSPCMSLVRRANVRARPLSISKIPRPAFSWLRVRLPWKPSLCRTSFRSSLKASSRVACSCKSLVNGWSKPCHRRTKFIESDLSSNRECRKLAISMRRVPNRVRCNGKTVVVLSEHLNSISASWQKRIILSTLIVMSSRGHGSSTLMWVPDAICKKRLIILVQAAKINSPRHLLGPPRVLLR